MARNVEADQKEASTAAGERKKAHPKNVKKSNSRLKRPRATRTENQWKANTARVPHHHQSLAPDPIHQTALTINEPKEESVNERIITPNWR